MQNKEQKYIALPVEQAEELGQYLLKLPAGQVLGFIGYLQRAQEGAPFPPMPAPPRENKVADSYIEVAKEEPSANGESA